MLESRRLLVAGVYTIDLTVPIQSSGEIDIQGVSTLKGSLVVLDPADLSQVNVTNESVEASGTFSGTVTLTSLLNATLDVEGTFLADNLPPTYEMAFSAPSSLDFFAQQTGTTTIQVGQFPATDGTFLATIEGSVDLLTGNASGLAVLQVNAGLLRETFTMPFDFSHPIDQNLFPDPTLASIADRVFADSNDNGTYDNGESGVGGVTITLVAIEDDSQRVVDSVVSDADGYYSFYNLPAGDYLVRIDGLPERFDIGRFQVGADEKVDSDVRSRTGISPMLTLIGADHLRHVDIALREVAFEWRNPNLAGDVNDDGMVTSLDALWIINEMARRGEDASLPSDRLLGAGFFDVTADGQISALDALRVINEMGRQQYESVETEELDDRQAIAPRVPLSAWMDPSWWDRERRVR